MSRACWPALDEVLGGYQVAQWRTDQHVAPGQGRKLFAGIAHGQQAADLVGDRENARRRSHRAQRRAHVHRDDNVGAHVADPVRVSEAIA